MRRVYLDVATLARRSAAIIGALMIGAIGATAAQRTRTPATTNARFDAAKIEQRTDTFVAYLVRGEDTMRVGTVTATIRGDDSTLTRIYVSNSEFAPEVDTIVDRRVGLSPLAHASYSTSGGGAVRFGHGVVKGWWRLVNGDSVTVSIPVTPSVYNAASFDLLVRASELREGFELTLDGFRLEANVVMPMRGRVTGIDTVDHRPCWVFKGVNGLLPVTFWIDQQSHALRRQLIQIQSGLAHLLATPPPKDIEVSDAEKAGLILDGSFLRHTAMGFVLPLPGPDFLFDTLVQRTMNASMGDPRAFGWSVRSRTPGLSLTIIIYKGVATGTDSAAHQFLAGFKRPVARRTGWTIVEDTVHWTAAEHEVRFAAQGPGGALLRSRCIPSPERITPGWMVCAQTVARYSDTMDFVTDELHFPKSGSTDYESVKGGFSVWFPQPPQISQLLTRDNEHLRLTRFKVADSSITFFVRYVDYTDSVTQQKDPQLVVDEERDWFVKAVSGHLVNERAVSCGRHPGDVFEVDNEDGSYHVKACFARPRMYLLYASSTRPMSLVTVALFLDSFRITESP